GMLVGVALEVEERVRQRCIHASTLSSPPHPLVIHSDAMYCRPHGNGCSQTRAGPPQGGSRARGALAAANDAVRLLPAPGARRARHADRGGHALPAAAASRGAGPARLELAGGWRPAAPLLR